MTDDRIAELLGWPAGRPDVHSRSLFMRVRAVVAAAQAEQDAHIAKVSGARRASAGLPGWQAKHN